MLKFLTHKLRTHSLNEGHPHYKIEDDDHDSGTESDDDYGGSEEPETSMESEGGAVALSRMTTPASPYFLDSALASDSDLTSCYDQHSSEEELEVINSANHHNHHHHHPHPRTDTAPGKVETPATLVPLRSRSASTLPEKRKWSQVTTPEVASAARRQWSHQQHLRHVAVRSAGAGRGAPESGSSDEEVQGLLATMSVPVQFRTEPPRGARKPGPAAPTALPTSPPAATHGHGDAASPRKRHRHAAPPPRPCLDFEKMQQLKARSVTAWRHSGEHGGELSVFCW